MPYRSSRPGDFSQTTTGKNYPHYHGWRRFNTNDSNIVHEDPNNQVDGATETTGTSVVDGHTTFTLTDSTSAVTPPADMGIWCQSTPLTDMYGVPVNFSSAFTLMTMVEFISVTGDVQTSGSTKHTPSFGLGIATLAPGGTGSETINTSDNKCFGSGLNVITDTPTFRAIRFSGAGGSVVHTVAGQKPLLVTDYHIGPGLGTYKEEDTNWIHATNFDTSGNSYAKFKPSSTTDGTLRQYQATDAASIDTDGPIYLFAFAGSYTASNGSFDPAVVKCRLWYMVNSDPSGWARFTG